MSEQTRGVPDVAGALPLYAALRRRRYTRAVQSRLHGESKEESSEGMTMTGTGVELLRRLGVEGEVADRGEALKRLMDLSDNGWSVPDVDEFREDKRRAVVEAWIAVGSPDVIEELANTMDGEPDRARFGQAPARLRKLAVAMRFEAVRQGRAGS